MRDGIAALKASIAPGLPPVKATAALRVTEPLLSAPVADRTNWTLARLAEEIARREAMTILRSQLSSTLPQRHYPFIIPSRSRGAPARIASTMELGARCPVVLFDHLRIGVAEVLRHYQQRRAVHDGMTGPGMAHDVEADCWLDLAVGDASAIGRAPLRPQRRPVVAADHDLAQTTRRQPFLNQAAIRSGRVRDANFCGTSVALFNNPGRDLVENFAPSSRWPPRLCPSSSAELEKS
jgi:hypothetical protein